MLLYLLDSLKWVKGTSHVAGFVSWQKNASLTYASLSPPFCLTLLFGLPPCGPVLLRNTSQGLANCPLPLPRSLALLAPNPAGESLPGASETADKNGAQVEVDDGKEVPGERRSMVLSNGCGTTNGESVDGGDDPIASDRVASEREDNRTAMEMLADHVRILF